jgi:hypothetical protein
VSQIGLSAVSLLLSLLSAAAVDVERSFLENRPDLLVAHFSASSRLSLSLPEPVAFSDQISSEQSYFLIQDILARFLTQEYFPESPWPGWLGRDRLILKARWSFQDKRTDDRHAFRLFILLKLEKRRPSSGRAEGLGKGSPSRSNPWKIIEIKAEKV